MTIHVGIAGAGRQRAGEEAFAGEGRQQIDEADGAAFVRRFMDSSSGLRSLADIVFLRTSSRAVYQCRYPGGCARAITTEERLRVLKNNCRSSVVGI